MIARLKKKWRILMLLLEEPLPEYEICDRCSCLITDQPKHEEQCK